MKIMVIANQKGGCGKTITAVSLAAVISGMGKRVLFVDLDPQAHATSAFGINITESSRSTYAIFNAFLNKEVVDMPSLMQYRQGSLWVIGSHISLSTIEQRLSGVKDAVLALVDALKSNTLSAFDYIIIDTPPSLGFLTLNAVHTANHLIVPLDVSSFSLNGVNQIYTILDLTKSMGFDRPKVNFLLTLFDGRSNFSKTFLEKARTDFGEQLFKTVIRSNVKLREAALLGKTIFEHNASANGAQDYTALALEIAPQLKGRAVDLKSAAVESDKPQTLFKYFAPEAKSVYLAGTFNNWATDQASLMKRLENGMWIKILYLASGTHYYKFVVDGQWKEDPENQLVESDKCGGRNSVVLVKG